MIDRHRPCDYPSHVAGLSRADAGGPAALLPLVFARPASAFAGAQAVLARKPSAFDASIAYQAMGLVERDFGDLAAAVPHLRRAVRLGRRSGSADREADAMAALGMALLYAGRTSAALSTLDNATTLARGLTAARVRYRLAGALRLLGRHDAALQQLQRALPALRRAGDTIWEARAVSLRALILLALGRAEPADEDLVAAGRMFAAADQEHDAVTAVHNRGLVAFRSGDLPTALVRFDEAEKRYAALGTFMADLSADRCALLLAAGLPREAQEVADAAIDRLQRRRGWATRRAELLLTAAHAAFAAGEPTLARDRARAAARLFAAQRREWWAAHCRLLLLQIEFGGRAATGRLARETASVAQRLSAFGATDAVRAHLLAGKVALALGRASEAERHLAAAARTRNRGPALARASGWLAQALRAEAANRPRSTLDACGRGLEHVDEHQLTLGAPELRAQASAHGAELAAVALRTCLRSGRPRQLLTWAERSRATAVAIAPGPSKQDNKLRGYLTRLREITTRVDATRARGTAVPRLLREQARVEDEIRARTRRLRGIGAGRDRPLSILDLLEALGDNQLLEIVVVDGGIHVLLCASGRVRRFAAGSADEAAAELEHARAALRRLAYPAASHPASEATLARLATSGARLQRILLGAAVPHLDGSPVVVIPPASLHGVPWPVLPALNGCALSIAPSARVWLRAHRTPRPASGQVVLVRGPGLDSGGGELSEIAAMYPGATLLEHAQATATRVLRALDGSRLAHVAAHGTFRAGSPYFSSLRLTDGPLTVHDFEHLRRAPHRLILPSCDSGRLTPAGADELLGLATALLPLGTAGMVASVVPVNDAATVTLMLALHQEIQRGASLAEALLLARSHLPGDPVSRAVGLSFVAIGAG